MADHFYSVASAGVAKRRQRSDITVGASSTGANVMEFRITDGSVSAAQAYDFLEYLADLFATRDKQVIATDSIL